MHTLLKRQLSRHFDEGFEPPPGWQEFIKAVNAAYEQSDADRLMLERSLELSSQELMESHQAEKESLLKKELQIIQTEKNRFQALAEGVPAGVLRTDADENCNFVNQEWLHITGMSSDEVQGKGWLQSVHPADYGWFHELYQGAFRRGNSFNSEYRIRKNAGKETWVYCKAIMEARSEGQKSGMIFCIVDLTERKNALKQIERSQRLQSIGVLAGGIAHDLNNALAPIVTGVDLFSKTISKQDRKMLEIIGASAKRGTDMVRNLLTFARGVEGNKGSVDLCEVVQEMGKVIRATFPKSIEIILEEADHIPCVLGNSTQLHQVFLNLAVNGRDAMPNGGTLTIRMESVRVDETYKCNLRPIPPGDYVVIHVQDTGVGMTPEIQDRIFEPFFTTKPLDRGTGLGLATTVGIVADHKGDVRVYSMPGQGARFSVYLPVNTSDGPQAKPADSEKDLDGQGQLVLLVDDEAPLRNVASTVLRRLNFKVVEAKNGTEGIGKLVQFIQEIKLIITDIHMPDMDGLSFIKEGRRLLPGIPFIAMSGRLETGEYDQLNGQHVSAILDKPFSAKKLAATLGSIEGLGGQAGGSAG